MRTRNQLVLNPPNGSNSFPLQETGSRLCCSGVYFKEGKIMCERNLNRNLLLPPKLAVQGRITLPAGK